jgi:hypothetical protein
MGTHALHIGADAMASICDHVEARGGMCFRKIQGAKEMQQSLPYFIGSSFLRGEACNLATSRYRRYLAVHYAKEIRRGNG